MYYPYGENGNEPNIDTDPPWHAVGEDPNHPGQWSSQDGQDAPIYDGIDDPDEHTNAYYCQVFPARCQANGGKAPKMKKVCSCVACDEAER